MRYIIILLITLAGISAFLFTGFKSEPVNVQAVPARPNIVLIMADARYVSSGNGKMVSVSNDTTWNLYDLAKDKAKTVDLASSNSSRVKELSALWRQWASNNKVFPKPGGR